MRIEEVAPSVAQWRAIYVLLEWGRRELPPIPPIPMKDADVAAYYLTELERRASTSGSFVIPSSRWFQFQGMRDVGGLSVNEAINHAIVFGTAARIARDGLRIEVPMDATPHWVSGVVTPSNVVRLGLMGGDAEFASLLAEVRMSRRFRLHRRPLYYSKSSKGAPPLSTGDRGA